MSQRKPYPADVIELEPNQRAIVIVGGKRYAHGTWLDTFNGEFLKYLDDKLQTRTRRAAMRSVRGMMSEATYHAVLRSAARAIVQTDPVEPAADDVVVAAFPLL